MKKLLHKVWRYIESFHTAIWIWEKIGIWPTIVISIGSLIGAPIGAMIALIKNWPWQLLAIFVPLFCLGLFLSLLLIAYYIKDRKKRTKMGMFEYMQQQTIKFERTRQRQDIIRNARTFVSRVTKERPNDNAYFKKELLTSEVFLTLRPDLSSKFISQLHRRTIISPVPDGMPITASEFLGELNRLKTKWRLS